ncbi:MAG TPA: phosphotransferase [Acidimicrobiales bacterium]|jgi:aminoglycoside phosphotransferase (APT) family kinase protein|nr:phosphotransferase [Acidimicrobiales bacterium]
MRWDAAAAVTPDAEPDDVGTAALAVRLAPDHASVEREAAAMRVARRHLGGAARVRAVMRLGDDPEPLWALVRDEVGGVPLPELIGFNLHRSDELLHGFAAHQAAIHRIPAAGLGDDHGLTVVDAEAEVARIDASRFPKERRWLDAHLPAPDDPVLCHGGYQPMSVFGPPAEDWETHGGAGRGLVTTNWCGAVLAEPAFDVAYTLVALWSAPFFAKNRAERTAIKMIRNTLINTYKQGYEEVRSLEGDRVRFWEAFHVLRGMARLDGSYDGTDSAFAPPDRGTLPTELAAELPRRYQQLTRVR